MGREESGIADYVPRIDILCLKNSLCEPLIRLYVKSLAADAGINKDVIFHSSRHTFAMLLMSNGFTIDEASELLGDTPLVAKVYARIHNEQLDKKIIEKLG